jgi:hypothetical protein
MDICFSYLFCFGALFLAIYIPYFSFPFYTAKANREGWGHYDKVVGRRFRDCLILSPLVALGVLVCVEVFSVPFYLMGFFRFVMGFAFNGDPMVFFIDGVFIFLISTTFIGSFAAVTLTWHVCAARGGHLHEKTVVCRL